MAERPTFSPFWHRVRAMKPRLRPHVQITRQFYRGRRWHVVRDPSSNQFYRLNPIAHEFVGLFDGQRTIEEIWKIVLERHGDAAPTQGEAIQLITQLYNSNLLAADVAPETEQLLQRGRERTKQKATQQAIGIMYFKIRVFNPDKYLSWVEPLFRPVLNRWGFLAWLLFMIYCLGSVLPEWETLASGVDSVIAPANWGWLIVVFIVTKGIHETGHGVICKRYGGQVPEFGFMLLVLFPAPYVDASSAWALPSKWKRMAVGAGGMIFELAVAGAAALVWKSSADGSLVRQIAYNAMFTASLSTILFNANPLMRFDGYFILSDLLEVPNLMQRSMKMLQYLWKVHVYRLKNETPPTSSRSEATILVLYGIGAMCYRVFLFVSITLAVMGRLFALGLVLAIWTAGMWFVLPIGKFVHWLATGNNIADCRARVIAISLASFAIGGGFLGMIPFPDHRRASGVVESVEDPGVFFGTAGFVETAHVRIGDVVREGDPLVTCSNDQMVSRLAQLNAKISEARAVEQRALGNDRQAEAQIARESLHALDEQLVYLQERLEKLVVRAPRDGTVVGQDPELLVGRYVEQGSAACQVIDPDDLRIVALLDQREAAWPTALGSKNFKSEVRLLSRVQDALPAEIVSIQPLGRELPHASFSAQGGGQVETGQDEQSSMLAKDPQLKMYLRLSDAGEGEWLGLPGERAKLRFTLPDKPLLVQWLDRLHKLVQGKVNI
ncbi:MAG: HlyD family efflux transporter periplasmic adaptor subunit [Planctomycetota bacterium]|nr:MAG: HlyD family efflux transporter periplasmic adaptor subunit [Planctomycetota bacterium]